jgi:cytochrome c
MKASIGFILATCLLSACDRAPNPQVAAIGGDPNKGKADIRAYGCASCHTIPGVYGADALVGPSLDHIASRNYIGGVVENTPQNLVEWVHNPKAIDAKAAMPNVHVSQADARDIASFLYTLR